ncbi:TIR domain-containing protein [Streptomyces sp. NPDC048241]|uniref:TIR domain-containing protein n=1 Tax=Streptomyces sp. NPDC048241 TaxID=3365521 RepID=UPI00371E9BE9
MERDCFISYSHKADIPLAEAVEKGLCAIGRAWTRRPALNVFRDTRSLAASADLPGAILKELERSRYFVYIASPEAAASRWVREELRFWRDHSDASARGRFLIALSAGEIHWNDSAGDFDWDRTTAIPDDLRGTFRTEPLWVDLRSFREGNARSLAPGSPFRDKVVTLGAAIRGCSKDELDSEDLRQQRRARRLRDTAIALLTTFALIASVSFVVALLQRDKALARARTSASQALAARAVQIAGTDPRRAAQFALYAEQVDPTSESLSALAQAVAANAYVVRHFQGGSGTVASYTGSGGGTPTRVAVSGDGSTLAYYTGFDAGDRLGTNPVIHLYDIRTRKTLPALRSEAFPLGGGIFELSADGNLLFTERAYNKIEVRDTRNGRVIQNIVASDGRKLCNACQGIKGFAMSTDGSRIAASFNEPFGDEDQKMRLAVWDSMTGKELSRTDADPGPITLSFGDAGELRAYAPEAGLSRSFDFTASAWSAARAERRTKTKSTTSTTPSVTPPDNRRIRIDAANGSVAVYDTQNHKQRTLSSFDFNVQSLSTSGDGHWVAAGSNDGAISLLQNTDPAVRHLSNDDKLKPGQISNDGRIGFRKGSKGGTDVWRLTDPQSGARRIGNLVHPAEVIASNSDGTRIVSSMGAGTLEAWDSHEDKNVIGGSLMTHGPYLYGNDEALRDMEVVGDGQHVVGMWNEGLKVVDLRTMKVSQVVDEEETGFDELAVSGDGRTVVATDPLETATVWRWNGDSGLRRVQKAKVTDEGVADLSVSDDGSKVAVVDGDSRISVLDTSDGSVVTASVAQGANSHAVFSSDSRLVMQSSDTGTESRLHFWDTSTGDSLGSWPLGPRGFAQISGTPSGGLLALTSDGALTRRSMSVEQWRSRLCSVVPDPLPKADYDRYLSGIDVAAPCRR